MSCPDLHTGWVNYSKFAWVSADSAWEGAWSGVEGYSALAVIPGSTFSGTVSASVTFVALTPPSGNTRLVFGGNTEVYDPPYTGISIVSHPGVGVEATYTQTISGLSDFSAIYFYLGPELGGGGFLIKDLTITPCPSVPAVTQPPVWSEENWAQKVYNGVVQIPFTAGCAEFSGSYVEYGSVTLVPMFAWNYGYRPGQITISSNGLDTWFGVTASIYVFDTKGNTLGFYNGPVAGDAYTIPLAWQGYDLASVALQGQETTLTLCGPGITFSAATCSFFWTNHLGQYEVCA